MKTGRTSARWRQTCLLLCLLLCLQFSAYAQPPASLESILATEDPNARIAALQKFLKTGNNPEQIQKAREAIVTSWAQVADLQLGENNIEKAVENFRRAITALPETITDLFFDETVIRIPLAVSVRGYRNEAIGLARQLEKRFAKEPKRLASLGEFHMTIEAPTDAIRALEAAVGLAEEDAKLHRLLGAAYRMGLRLDEAIAEYQLAIRYDEKDRRAYYELANLYRAHGAYQDAIKLYRKQIEIDPKHLPSYKGLALAYLATGNEEQMAASLNQARDLRGAMDEITQDIYLQTQLAFYYLAQNKLKPARQAAEAALVVEPRYSWARIAAAEVDLAEGKYFEAERNLMAAKAYASFPSLFFTIGKLYLAVEDFDGALEQFEKAFSYSPENQFTARLGGALDVQADNLKELLAREHQAAIYLAEPVTTAEVFKIAEALVRFNVNLRIVRPPAPTNRAGKVERTAAKSPAEYLSLTRKRMEELDRAAMDFIEVESVRRSFRMLYIARQLAQAGVAVGLAQELADQALGLAEVATEPDGSLRDYPNYDRDGRLKVFRGRALDAKGWALFKAEKTREAGATLAEAVAAYGSLPEGRRAMWHLATVKETEGELKAALELYLAGYTPPENVSDIDVNRAVIESLYRKLHGSTDGLNERLGIATTAQTKSPPEPAAKSKGNDALAKLEPKANKVPARKGPQLKAPIAAEPVTGERHNPPLTTAAEAKAELKPVEPVAVEPSVTSQPARQEETKPVDPPVEPARPRLADLPPAPATSTVALSRAETPVNSIAAPPTATSETEAPPPPTETTVKAAPPAPVELPVIAEADNSLPLRSWIGWVKIISTLSYFSPPPNTAEETPPVPPGPKLHTRKRRVTVPDDQPPKL